MTVKNANAMRAKFIKFFMEYAQESGEDVGLEAANIFSFPVVADDGEEGACRSLSRYQRILTETTAMHGAKSMP